MNTSLASLGLIAPICLVFLMGQTKVYRCIDPATNATRFSDVPCQTREQESSRIVRPNSISTQGAREQALLQEIRQLQGQLRDQESRSYSTQTSTGMTQSDLQAQRIDARACEQARRSYEVESGSISKSAARVKMKREAMYGACGMREPDRTEINVIDNRRDEARHVEDHGERRNGSHVGPSMITNCDAGGCWDNLGGRYNRGAGDTYFGPSGSACQMVGTQMICP